jgi:hypothetical protein
MATSYVHSNGDVFHASKIKELGENGAMDGYLNPHNHQQDLAYGIQQVAGESVLLQEALAYPSEEFHHDSPFYPD